jgi:uncharacterized protein YxeA
MKKILIIITVIIAFGFTASAQTYQVPTNYVLKEKGDYGKYEQDVISTIDWLQDTPWAAETQKRDDAKAFFMKWLEGSPNVNIEINKAVGNLCTKNPELFGSFMGGYTKYALQNKTAFNKDKANEAGIKAIISKYISETDHKKNSDVEKLIKVDKEGKLASWITTDFYKS